jgi:hypothetical protein
MWRSSGGNPQELRTLTTCLRRLARRVKASSPLLGAAWQRGRLAVSGGFEQSTQTKEKLAGFGGIEGTILENSP